MAWRTSTFAIGLVVLACSSPAFAEYPERPINLIVPFPPGGSTTIVARIIAEKMSDDLGQSVVIDNHGGAGGTIGTRFAAKSAPDGYTILLSYTGTMAIAPSIYRNVEYDVRKDFAPIGRIGAAPSTVVVHPSVPAKSLQDLIAYAKANPGVNFGTAGVGSLNHVAGEYLATQTGIKLTHVPYKGTGPAIADAMGGHIPMALAPIPAVLGQIRGGTLRILAVTSAKRSSVLPDVPTVAESGVPGFDAVLLYGLAAPAGTPRPIVERLNKALRAALATDEVKKRLATEGADLSPSTAEEYAADMDREEKQWSQVVKAAGLKGE